MALTPERRPSTGSSTDLSIPNQLQRRRYSRAYKQPTIEKTAKGIMVLVQEEPYEGMTEETPGEVLNPEASKFGNLMAKLGIVALTLLGVAASVVGHTPLVAAVQLLGFLIAFSAIFALYVGLFLWWGSWCRISVQPSVKTVATLCGVTLLCDISARAVLMYVSIPDLPFEAFYYILVGTLLFFILPLSVHKDGLNGMFSQEMCVYVGLTIFLDYCSVSMFGYVLPPFLLTQVVCASTFLGLTLSLVGHRFPQFSLTETYWKLKKRKSRKESSLMRLSVSKKPSNAPSIAGSIASNVPSRLSYSSVSSLTSAFPQVSLCPD